MDHHQMLLSILYRLVRCLLDLTAVLVRRGLSKNAELLVLRHENAVSHRQVARVNRSTPGSGARSNARGHFPTEAAALKCVYLAIMSLDPTGKGQ